MNAAALSAFIVRIGLVLLFFPCSALDKVFGFEHAVKQAREVFKPRLLGIFIIVCGLMIEIGCSLGIISGIADRVSAVILAAYCAATAVLYKRFWSKGDFWSNPDGQGRSLFWDFMKNLALGAGFLLVVVGPDGSGLYLFLDAPLASSHPYARSSHE